MPLGIDFKQIFLHAFNFFVLVIVLYLLLYKPIKQFLTKRKEYFSEQQKEAETKILEAKQIKLDSEAKVAKMRAELEVEKAKIINKAREEASKIIEDAKRNRQMILDKVQLESQAEKNKIISEANREIRELFNDIAEKNEQEGSLVSLFVRTNMSKNLGANKNTNDKLDNKLNGEAINE